VRGTLATAVKRVVETITEHGGPQPEDRESYETLRVLAEDV
jgi:hypothetical protein